MSDNFDNIFNELTPVSKNHRYAKQNSHLMFDPEKGSNGKFKVADRIFRDLNLNDHGFQLYTGNGQAYVAILPNEEAVSYAGRPDAENKSDEFASTEMRDELDAIGLTGNEFWLEYAGTKDNNDFYRLLEEDPTTEGSESEETDTLEASEEQEAEEATFANN